MASTRSIGACLAILLGVLSAQVVMPACGGQANQGRKSDRAIVALRCDVPDAEVWVDGRYFREVAELKRAFRLRAGEHRIEVRHHDYHSMYYELSVQAGTRHTLRVELAKRLP
ncbi:MAG: hypothetical protein GY811_05015 [Myxococcales bacterium]|nr:hypothetical protein [Myxococcales bacterium]